MPKTTPQNKPKKPRSDFPLFAHQNGQWAKTVRGRHHYFGPWSDPQAAETKWLEQKDDLRAGRTPSTGNDGLKLVQLVNQFLTSKKRHAEAKGTPGALRTFNEYYDNCE